MYIYETKMLRVMLPFINRVLRYRKLSTYMVACFVATSMIRQSVQIRILRMINKEEEKGKYHI